MNSRKILAYAVGPVGSALLGLVTLPIITWFYNIEDVGRISMLQVTVSFSTLLFCLGLDQAFVREYHEEDNKALLFKNVIVLPVLIILIAGFSLFFYDSSLISQFLYSNPDYNLSLFTLLCCFFALISRFISLILRMEERALAYSMSQLLPKFLFLLFVVIGTFFLNDKGFDDLILAYVVSFFSVAFIYMFNSRFVLGKAALEKIDINRQKYLLVFGLPLIIGGLASWGLRVMDRMFLRAFSNFAELGLYSVTMSLAGAATIFGSIFTTIWAPMIYKWIKEKEDLSKIDHITDNMLAIIYFVFGFSGLFSWVIPVFLPQAYENIEQLFVICLSGPLFYVLSECCSMGISVSRKTYVAMFISVFSMIVNFIGNYLLVSKFGATGAAVSTCIAFFIFFVLRTELSARLWRGFPRRKLYFISTTLLIFCLVYVFFPSFGVKLSLLLLFFGVYFFKANIKALCFYIKYKQV
ncbi:lipopolysaccharide biosynthesis protein [Photobacterium sp. TLY01]|uniref:lipopolysaccharide biosynthesis protein n=1 Tax=Photobacterium sp. TLY01 TaxID=2907534 RepID=UPI001F313083|nr:oligosaccharide flippase family protein [Photobacterium sp. TLY01]UIP27227.1 oligosaccharide flippase family protein [Photobacterium sp. TLY01]